MRLDVRCDRLSELGFEFGSLARHTTQKGLISSVPSDAPSSPSATRAERSDAWSEDITGTRSNLFFVGQLTQGVQQRPLPTAGGAWGLPPGWPP